MPYFLPRAEKKLKIKNKKNAHSTFVKIKGRKGKCDRINICAIECVIKRYHSNRDNTLTNCELYVGKITEKNASRTGIRFRRSA